VHDLLDVEGGVYGVKIRRVFICDYTKARVIRLIR